MRAKSVRFIAQTTRTEPTNSIISAVATAWELETRRKAAKADEKNGSRQKEQINHNLQ